jgi:alpha-L-fucosidase
MTRYGKIDYLWYDGCIPDNLQSREVNEEILRLQPDIIINERNGEPWHVKNCEQAIKPAGPGVVWEACMTLNDNWAYHAGDTGWKSPRQVVKMLTETASKAGNLLLNVGPKADGTIPEESASILRNAGAWLRKNGESIYGSSRSPFTWNNWGRITTSGSNVYLHIFNSTGPELCFAEMKNRVISARFLDGGSPVVFEQKENRLFLRGLPVPLPDSIATTIVLQVEGEPEPITLQTSFWIPGEPAT